MIIKGLQKTTLLDYPGHVAATIFLGGCNFRCPFCHNMDIVINKNDHDSIDEEEIISFLKKRSGVLEGVCVTGGEPTLYKDLPLFLEKIKRLGYLIKLDTNGTNPDMVKKLTKDKLIDYVAMDIKASYDNYLKVSGVLESIKSKKSGIENTLTEDEINKGESSLKIENNLIDKIKESVEFLKSGAISHEFRTTIVAQYHDITEIKKIGEILKDEENYYLQSYKESEYVTDKTLMPVSENELKQFVEILKDYVKNPQIRGL